MLSVLSPDCFDISFIDDIATVNAQEVGVVAQFCRIDSQHAGRNIVVAIRCLDLRVGA